MQYVFHAPFLVSTQIAQQSVGKEALFLNFPGKVFRKPVHSIAIAQQSRNDFLKRIGV